MTIEQAMNEICKRPGFEWTRTWFRQGEIIVQTPGRSWATRNGQDQCPSDIQALGCSGEDWHGRASWIGFDLDVGHGKKSYGSTFIAEQAARMIRDRLGGYTEIRRSKSGSGVHVRHVIEGERPLQKDAGKLCKEITDGLGIKADPTALTRQQFWLWARNPGPDGFKLVC